MQSLYCALYELITLVRNGMKLMDVPNDRLDSLMQDHIRTLKRHRQESEYAETEMLHTGLSVRHINEGFFNGAIVYQTKLDGKQHLTNEFIEEEGTVYFPKDIIERL